MPGEELAGQPRHWQREPMLETLAQRGDPVGLAWELAAQCIDIVPCVVELPLAQGGVDGGDELLKLVGSGARRLTSAAFPFELPLLGKQSIDVGVLGEERFPSLAPRIREISERLLDLARLYDCGLGHRSGFLSECTLVHCLRLLADALCLGKTLFELAL